MARVLDDWLERYLEYVEETESATIFKRWVGISVIASALRRKVSFKLGRLTIYPNFYIVLVGPPGSRKSEAIKFGHSILKEVPNVVISADAITREALIKDLESSKDEFVTKEGKTFPHCSMTVRSSEFETFIGAKTENAKMLNLLTDLWDCPEHDWSYRTKGSGSNRLENVFINLIAATTPDSLAKCIPSSADGTGFTARFMFCYAQGKSGSYPIPETSERIEELKKDLAHDLCSIALLYGQYTFNEEGRKFWEEWYIENDRNPKRICQDSAFNHWYDRKSVMVLKLCMILKASRSDATDIGPEIIQEALQLIEEVEKTMGEAFKIAGGNKFAAECDMVFEIIKRKKVITDRELRRMTWRDLDNQTYENVIATVYRTGKVIRDYSTTDIIYRWKGEGAN